MHPTPSSGTGCPAPRNPPTKVVRASSTRSAPGIAFDYRASHWVGGLAWAGSFVALAAPWLSGLPVAARMLLSLTALLVAINATRRFNRPGFRRIAYGAVGWTLLDSSDVELHVDLIAHTRM